MILLISYQYYVCQKKAAYSIGTESLSHIEVLNKKRKCPEIRKSRPPFPFSIDNLLFWLSGRAVLQTLILGWLWWGPWSWGWWRGLEGEDKWLIYAFRKGWVYVSEWVSKVLPLLIYNQALSSRPGGLKGLLMIMVMTTKVIRCGLRVCENTQIQRVDDFSYCYFGDRKGDFIRFQPS